MNNEQVKVFFGKKLENYFSRLLHLLAWLMENFGESTT
jgi:hypothetical protein